MPQPPARKRSASVPCGHEFDFELAGQILPLELAVLADVGSGRSPNPLMVEQHAQSPPVHAAVVRDRDEIGGALFEQRLDQVVRDAAEAEAADRQRRPAGNVGDRVGARRVDFLHDRPLCGDRARRPAKESPSRSAKSYVRRINDDDDGTGNPRPYQRRRGADARGRPRTRRGEGRAARRRNRRDGEFPWDVKELFAQNDLLGMPIPAEYGGLGGTFLTYVKVVEEIAKACASSSLIVAVQELGMLPIMIAGSEEQKHRFLPKIASGEHLAAYALTEVSSGSDALGSMRTRAERRR